MFEVKANNEYKNHFIGNMMGTTCCVIIDIMAFVFFIMLILDRNLEVAIFIGLCIICITEWFIPVTLKSVHIMFDKYVFYDDGFTIELFYGKKVKYSLDEILLCEYYPDCALYRGLYSDTIFFRIKKMVKREIPFYKDFCQNYDQLRTWVLKYWPCVRHCSSMPA